MGSITVDDFKIGKDSRKGASVADADRLLKLTNAYINKGKIPKKRQGSVLDVELEAGTKGLISAGGFLNTFYGKGVITHTNPLYKPNLVNGTVGHPTFTGTGRNDGIAYGEYTGLSDAEIEVEISWVERHTNPVFTDSIIDPGNKTRVSIWFASTPTSQLVDGAKVDISGTTGYNGVHIVSDLVQKTGSITAFADSPANPGVWTRVSVAAHTWAVMDIIEITGTTNYNGTYSIEGVGAGFFDIVKVFSVDDATGTTDSQWFDIDEPFGAVEVSTGVVEASKWRWRKNGGSWSTGIFIDPAVGLTVTEGILFKFPTIDQGRILNDKWTFTVKFYNSVKDIHFGDSFLGFLYVVVEYDTGYVRHHYLDGSDNTTIADPNCPHSKGVTKMESKIWAVNGDTVSFSAVANPKDWTTSEDAGFLPTGLRTKNADNAIALGQYGKHQLIVLFHDGAQLWTVDPDPALNVYEKELEGFHTQFPRSVLKFAGDLFVLGDGGVRSTTEKVFSENINEEDVGSPIDADIKAVLTDSSTVLSGRYKKIGQYWIVIDDNVFVYTFSRSAKISAWSIYEYPFSIEAMEEQKGNFYLRSGNKVYRVSESVYTDDGVIFDVEIQTAFLNAKEPGIDKQWHGMDVIFKGSADVSYLWDPNDLVFSVTAPVSYSGDTMQKQRAPIEIVAPSLSFLYQNSTNEDFELQSFTAYFTSLGLQ